MEIIIDDFSDASIKDRYANIDMGDFHKGEIICESHHSLEVDSEVDILIEHNPILGVYGPDEAYRTYAGKVYRTYAGKVRWVLNISHHGSPLFAMVVKIKKSYEMRGEKKFRCSLCGDLVMLKKQRQVFDYVYVCSDCGNHLAALPEGIIKNGIERFMIGNVI